MRALGEDPSFKIRIRTLMRLEAGAVYGEAGGTPNHGARALFASKLAANPGIADSYAPLLATRTNLAAANATYNFATRAVECDASDASIRSQINTDWNLLASV
jgi:hypothetical protein